jgi:hypothetical protein
MLCSPQSGVTWAVFQILATDRATDGTESPLDLPTSESEGGEAIARPGRIVRKPEVAIVAILLVLTSESLPPRRSATRFAIATRPLLYDYRWTTASSLVGRALDLGQAEMSIVSMPDRPASLIRFGISKDSGARC